MVTPMRPGSTTSTPRGTYRPGDRSLLTNQPAGHVMEGTVMESQGLMVSRKASVTVSVDVEAADAVVTPTPATAATAAAVTRRAAGTGPTRGRFRRWGAM